MSPNEKQKNGQNFTIIKTPFNTSYLKEKEEKRSTFSNSSSKILILQKISVFLFLTIIAKYSCTYCQTKWWKLFAILLTL
jgi:hypothetical protein